MQQIPDTTQRVVHAELTRDQLRDLLGVKPKKGPAPRVRGSRLSRSRSASYDHCKLWASARRRRLFSRYRRNGASDMGDAVLRLHLTYEDMAKVAFSATPSQVSEAVLSLQVLFRGDQHARFGPWRVALNGRIPAAVELLGHLVPARGWIPDFLTPAVRDSHDVAVELEAVRATSVRQVRDDLGLLAATRRLPGWAHSLADGDGDVMGAVVDALSVWHRLAIAPHAVRIQAAMDADIAQKTGATARHGIGAVLRHLHPAITWSPPVLTLPSSVDLDIDLAGRGLLLVPMLFCGPLPRLRLTHDGGRPVLAYQMSFDPVTANPFAETGERGLQGTAALGRLLGGTRSSVLRVIAATPGLTMAELAYRADIALATASEHASVLREAGLVTRHRDGNRVRHYPTATAMALLGTAG